MNYTNNLKVFGNSLKEVAMANSKKFSQKNTLPRFILSIPANLIEPQFVLL
jgi:hypothetical protein